MYLLCASYGSVSASKLTPHANLATKQETNSEFTPNASAIETALALLAPTRLIWHHEQAGVIPNSCPTATGAFDKKLPAISGDDDDYGAASWTWKVNPTRTEGNINTSFSMSQSVSLSTAAVGQMSYMPPPLFTLGIFMPITWPQQYHNPCNDSSYEARPQPGVPTFHFYR